MVKFKLKGTTIKALTINEKTGESGDIEVFVSKRYKTKTDRSVKSMINQITSENSDLLAPGVKIIYIKSFEPCDKLYGMDIKTFLSNAHPLTPDADNASNYADTDSITNQADLTA